MIDRMIQRPVQLIMIALVALVLLSQTISVVPETKQAIISRYSQPLRVVNAYQKDERFGATNAGLAFRIPFVEQIHWVDKRVLSVQMEKQEVQSTDRFRLLVDAFARYRIVRPVAMYKAIKTEEALRIQLQTILESSLRNELGKRSFETLLSAERGVVMENIEKALNRDAAKYGVRIIDVRIKGTDLPDGGPLQSAFSRMQSAQNQQAIAIDSEGKKVAQIIRAEADAEAARIYAVSYGKDAGFYDFYRAMQSYKKTLHSEGRETNIIMSPDNDYLRKFRNGQ
jgi:modulator of FtsH protease HflC